MREIKYRARFRRISNGKTCWQYAYLMNNKIVNPLDDAFGFIQDTDWEQLTGLKDKNGVEIFEGDIIKAIATPPRVSTRTEFIGSVKWDAEDTGFFFETNSNWPCIKPWFVEDIEIVGNIHQNPDLLEVPA